MSSGEAFPARFASNEAEARTKAEMWAHRDPFNEEISPSLLSQIEIERYVHATSLIYPFDQRRLKTSSYEGRIGARAFVYENGKRRELRTESLPGGLLEVGANSIIFVESDITFHLPLYIGLRFNLQILHVHRGLLLGTGPLIDPGFSGKILIPLHNLTSEPHHIGLDEGLIWIEFTKTTYKVENDPEQRIIFPEYKSDRDSTYWLNKAAYNRKARTTVPISSSIPEAILDAQNSERIATNTRRLLYGVGVGGTIAIFLASLTLYYTFFQATYQQVDQGRQRIEAHISSSSATLQQLKEDNVRRELAVEATSEGVEALRTENAALREMLYDLRARVRSLEGPAPAPQ